MFGLSPQVSFDWLEDHLRQHWPVDWAALQPGLTSQQIADLEMALDVLELPGVFKLLYQWHNGQHKDDEAFLNTSFSWLSAEAIVEQWQCMKNLAEKEDWLATSWWNLQWVPFGMDGSGNLLCLDLSGLLGGPTGQVFEWVHDCAGWPIRNSSLEKWLECICLGLHSGLLKLLESAYEKTNLSSVNRAKYSSEEMDKHFQDLDMLVAEWRNLVWETDPGYTRYVGDKVEAIR